MDKYLKADKMSMDIMSSNLRISMLPGRAAVKTECTLQNSTIYHSLVDDQFTFRMLTHFNTVSSVLNAAYYCLEACSHNMHICIMKPFSLYHTEYNMLHSDIFCCSVTFLVQLYMTT
jgi:hypothetical protein